MTTISAPPTGHIGLNVTDLDRSLAFYRDVIGFEVTGEGAEDGRRYAFLGRAGTLALTLWQQASGAYDSGRAGLHHLSFEVESVDVVRDYERDLRAHGVEFAYDGVVPHGEGAASGGIFFHDPDGTRLEIYTRSGAGTGTAPSGSAPTCGFF
ncbi:VOC family protein [Streptomyces sp. AN091965]|uniref:VOC family protein n=1 Tax=Streptomyces sp. AN091965 TaxID=2927803 RepID=UPI001F61F295|nr:VOC family protein [Streptomyces sp. AN091965]MCI3930721.1 VOC family protein [Streptomyces sp. AN091965]